jgi:hypothetical protein
MTAAGVSPTSIHDCGLVLAVAPTTAEVINDGIYQQIGTPAAAEEAAVLSAVSAGSNNNLQQDVLRPLALCEQRQRLARGVGLEAGAILPSKLLQRETPMASPPAFVIDCATSPI